MNLYFSLLIRFGDKDVEKCVSGPGKQYYDPAKEGPKPHLFTAHGVGMWKSHVPRSLQTDKGIITMAIWWIPGTLWLPWWKTVCAPCLTFRCLCFGLICRFWLWPVCFCPQTTDLISFPRLPLPLPRWRLFPWVTPLGVDLHFGLYRSWTSCFGLLFQKTSLTPWSLPPPLGEEADSAQDSLCGFLASRNFSNSQRFASPIDRKIKCFPFTVYWIIVVLNKTITGILRLCAANPYSLFFLFYIENMNI